MDSSLLPSYSKIKSVVVAVIVAITGTTRTEETDLGQVYRLLDARLME